MMTMPFGSIGSLTDVSRVILGTSRHHRSSESSAVLAAYADAGGVMVDTALAYGDGESDRCVGRWLRRHGHSMLVTGKGGHPPQVIPRDLRQNLLHSLRNLGIERFDLYLAHRDNEAVPVEAIMVALADLRDEGLTREYGVSNWSLPRTLEALSFCAAHGLPAPAVVSNQFSLARPNWPPYPGSHCAYGTEWTDLFRRSDIRLLAWSSLARGYFAGRQPAPIAATWANEANDRVRRRVRALADEEGVHPCAVALRSVLSRSWAFPIIGPATPAELDECLRGADASLAVDELGADFEVS